ncbi:MAG: putative sulfate exporter family transporter [Bacillota bacterium]
MDGAASIPKQSPGLSHWGWSRCRRGISHRCVVPLVQADDDETAPVSCNYCQTGYLGSADLYHDPSTHTLSLYAYGVLTGSTLHEVGHVLTAAMVGGKVSAEIAILVKLGRVCY